MERPCVIWTPTDSGAEEPGEEDIENKQECTEDTGMGKYCQLGAGNTLALVRHMVLGT